MRHISQIVKTGAFLLCLLWQSAFSSILSAQPMGQGTGMMGGDRPEEMVRMMQEQNKVLANASIQYLAAFTSALHLQASQRQSQIDLDFIKAAFGEMERSFALIEQFQKSHVKTMDSAIQAKVGMMMERMNRNLSGLKEHLDSLRKEIQGGQNLQVIASRTGEMLNYLEDLSKMRAAQGGRQDLPGKKDMMK
jgi:ribosomal protein S15P/S13E